MRKAGALCAVLWMLAWITGVVWWIAGDAAGLERDMRRAAPSPVTGLPESEYAGVCRMTADYLTGRADAFQYRYTAEDGTERVCFQEHEAVHMADVRKLIALDQKVCLACAAAALLLTVLALRKPGNRAGFGRGIRRGMAGAGILILGLLLWAAVDFDGLFVTFHRTAFDNEGWLLDPRTDLLIRLMPTGFFIALGIRGLLMTLVAPAALTVAAWALTREKGNRNEVRGSLPQTGRRAEGKGNDPDPGAGNQL